MNIITRIQAIENLRQYIGQDLSTLSKTFNITSGNKTLQIEINVNDEGNISINEAIKTDNLSNQDFG